MAVTVCFDLFQFNITVEITHWQAAVTCLRPVKVDVLVYGTTRMVRHNFKFKVGDFIQALPNQFASLAQ